MRLVQLARKLGVTQNEIIRFLSGQGVDIGQSSNAKVNEEHTQLIYNHFGNPNEQLEEDKKIEESSEETTEPLLSTQGASENSEFIEPQEAEPAVQSAKDEQPGEVHIEDTKETQSEEDKQQTEVIRAKKIKLEGIKVLGKIELPEPPKKEEKTDESNDQQVSAPSRNRKKDTQDRKSQKRQTKRKKTESYEQKLKRQEREALRKKREREKKLKDKKKRFYEEQVKSAPQEKIKKKPSKKPAKKQEPASRKRLIKKHSNPIIRFWEWLNGKYD
ncbi:translation initiation factor IF-2 [Fulvivirga imtechensis AK7]|uniref:Translation initiation factor IF-2 n=1 Tax=Fulvivirga imtechensis AK7 TaxID=1237149 RepID=L8K1U9_9BACT|nr:translation initiation factor IF-2 N-terminal domain-containing protein [Fulvivirga imtechensis]ELR73432.1 translation initiation factor IF-2 [Fulvivirga imtechensis AK7]